MTEKIETNENKVSETEGVQRFVIVDLPEKDKAAISDIIRGLHYHFSNCPDMRLARILRRP